MYSPKPIMGSIALLFPKNLPVCISTRNLAFIGFPLSKLKSEVRIEIPCVGLV